MSGRRPQFAPLPADTARAARSIFHLENLYLLIGNQLEQLLEGINLADLDPANKKPVSMLALEALITIFQYAEDLPDRMAADATRKRMDWKYALHLSLSYPGVKAKTLCQFRQRLWLNQEGQEIFEQITHRIAGVGLLSKRAKMDHQAHTVLQTVCTLTRLDELSQAFNHALESLAAWQPEFLRGVALPHWYARYDRKSLKEPVPQSPIEQAELARNLGADARHLLKACCNFQPRSMMAVPEIQQLNQVFHEQFCFTEDEVGWNGEFYWRPERCASCSR